MSDLCRGVEDRAGRAITLGVENLFPSFTYAYPYETIVDIFPSAAFSPSRSLMSFWEGLRVWRRFESLCRLTLSDSLSTIRLCGGTTAR